jgi:hypothetical protein
LNNKNMIKPLIVTVLWVFLFICTIMLSRFLDVYWGNFKNLFYVLIGFVLVISLVYVASMKILGYKISLQWITPKRIILYLIIGILLILTFNGMAAIKTKMQIAGEVANMDSLLGWNSVYTILGILAGMILNFKGILNILKGNIRLNVYIIPAFILAYMGSIYMMLYTMSIIEFGFNPKSFLGLIVGVFKNVELQFVFILSSGYLLVRGSEHRARQLH